MYHIKKGLDLPLAGAPAQDILEDKSVQSVALLGPDYVGMRPSLLVKEGQTVRKGQPVFTCKKTAGVSYCAPAAGRVVEINRGERRSFQSLVIALSGGGEQVEFSRFKVRPLEQWSATDVRGLLLESGLWIALRTRPLSKVPSAEGTAHSLFVNAMDTRPHCPDPARIIHPRQDDFRAGLTVLARLMEDKKVYVCHRRGDSPPVPELENVECKVFAGVHPAGLPGTHIHFVDPVGQNKTVWSIGHQDVLAIGHLFLTGKLDEERIISLAGPQASRPRLVRTRLGANIGELIAGEFSSRGKLRPLSGSVLAGRVARGPFDYLGRYHNQVSLIAEDRQRHLLGWQGPGWGKFSVSRVFASAMFKRRRFSLGTNRHGSDRAMVPVGLFEKVMPLDLLPTQLLRALVTADVDLATQLGALELDEEDLALCTFASPGKVDFGPMLRQTLETVEREG